MMKSSNHMPSDLPHLLFICPLQESGTAFVQSFIVNVAKLLHIIFVHQSLSVAVRMESTL